MTEYRGNSSIVRFGPYEADLAAGQLRKHGLRVKLQDQPFSILASFLERPGEVVTRDHLRQRLWPEGTFVDFDNSLNAAINKLREALGDSADNPRYVETLPRRGYRFIAPVNRDAQAEPTGAPAIGTGPGQQSVEGHPLVAPQPASPPAIAPHPASVQQASLPVRRIRFVAAVAGLVLLVSAAAYIGFKRIGPRASAASGKAMLAVLPFQNMSGDPSQDYFSEGLTEEMIAQISRLQPEQLGVIARSTAAQYRRSSKGIDEIARELGIQYALEGSVRRDGDHIRITAQLIEARDQTHIWAATYERDTKDVLAIQQDVAGQVARALAVHLLPSGTRVIARASTSSPEAFESYVQARFYWGKRTEEGVRRSIQLFEEAIRRDPNYALAYAGLADSYLVWGGRLSGVPPAEAYVRARSAAKKALALDESLAEAHIAYSAVLFDHDWNFAEAEKSLKRGLELNPSYAFGHQWNAEFLAATGHPEEALQAIDRSLALDPFARSANQVRGQVLMYLRRYDEAVKQFQQLTEIDSTFVAAYASMARVYRLQGNTQEWFAAHCKWYSQLGAPPEELARFTEAFHKGGMSGALHYRISILETRANRVYGAAYAIARIHAVLGENDKALEWLIKASEERDDFATHITVDPEFDSLRNDARFQQLLKRVGFLQIKKS